MGLRMSLVHQEWRLDSLLLGASSAVARAPTSSGDSVENWALITEPVKNAPFHTTWGVCKQPDALVQAVPRGQPSVLLDLSMPFACEPTLGSAEVSKARWCVLPCLAGLWAAEGGVQL